MNESDLLISLLKQCGGLAAIVWMITQSLGKGVPFLRPVPQEAIALVLGPLIATLTHWFAPDWIGVGDAVGVKAYFAAGFLGLAGTLVAGKLHDWGLGRVTDALAGP